MAIGYKICTVYQENLLSYNTTRFDYLCVEYEIGKPIKAPNNTRLFIFSCLEKAKNFKEECDGIFTCEYDELDAIEENGMISSCKSHFDLYWKWFNSGRVGECPVAKWQYSHVLMVSELTLLERIA